MKLCRNLFKLGLACLAVGSLFVSNANAGPIVFCSNGSIDLVNDGCISGTSRHYTPTTTDGFYSNAGGGDPEAKVEEAILHATGTGVNIFLYGASDTTPSLFNLTGVSPAGQSGTWAVVDNTVDIAYITVKAANSFALYEVSDPKMGMWTTAGILNNGNQQPTVSHIRFWTTQDYKPPVPPTSVPVPGTLLLLGGSMLGMALWRRRRA